MKLTHSLPSSVEVKNEWRYTSSPPCLRGVEGNILPFYFAQKELENVQWVHAAQDRDE